MGNLTANNDLLGVSIGITASPTISFEKVNSHASQGPHLVSANGSGGFTVYLDVAVQYASFSRIVNAYIAGKRFDVSEGLLARHVVVKDVTIAGTINGEFLLKVDFTGSFNGTVYFNGKPAFNADSNTLAVQNLDYNLRTNSFLLKTAKWLFAGKIEAELKKVALIDLSSYFVTARKSLNAYLNQEWTKGIKGSGTIQDLRLDSLQALPQHLLLKMACIGKLNITLSENDLNFQR